MKPSSNQAAQFFLCAALVVQPAFSYAGIFDSLKNAMDNALDMSTYRRDIYKSAEDKKLVDEFYFISEDGKEQGVPKSLTEQGDYRFVKLTANLLTFSDLYYKGYMAEAERVMAAYSHSPLDVIGKRYVALANARGNLVRQYKPQLTGVLNNMLVQNLRYMPGPNVRTWLAKDNTLIEFNPKGEMVSVMTRSHRAIENLGTTSDMYYNLYFGKDLMRLVENRVSNRMFDDNFQRVVVLDAAEPSPSGEVIGAAATNTATPDQPVEVQTQAVVVNSETATAKSEAPATTGTKTALTSEEKVKLLQQLADLKKSGALTSEEFTTEKNKLLAQ